MSTRIKAHIINRVLSTVVKKTKLVSPEQLASHITLKTDKNSKLEWQLNLPLKFTAENEKDFESLQFHLPGISTDEIIKSVELANSNYNKSSLNFLISTDALIQDVLNSDPTSLNFEPQKEKVVVEFSSLNIAKPFHVGHLRSTIIGNFIANLKQTLRKDVVKINFLGDWGTQFGVLKMGIEMAGISEQALTENPVQLLYEAYVKANSAMETEPELRDKAREAFQSLESGDGGSRALWLRLRSLTVTELSAVYARLGVKFDEYHWESDYDKEAARSVVEALTERGVISIDDKGRTVARLLDRQYPLLKSDGASLYLLRDLAAAKHRQKAFQFDQHLYVVENGQADHFQGVLAGCRALGVPRHWAMQHVKFGRVHGMSTRRGGVVFLKDILDEARDIMYEKQLESSTTKGKVTLETADLLGTSAVILNDLKLRRQKDYDFTWDKALQTTGDSAIRLQYTHCRLVSLSTLGSPATQADPAVLSDPESLAVILQLSRFEEVLLRADRELEACVLVSYLFQLTHAINKALLALKVKDSSPHIASQRLLLFDRSRCVLAAGLRILGVTPMNEM